MTRKDVTAIAEALGISEAPLITVIAVRAACADRFHGFQPEIFNEQVNRFRQRVGLPPLSL